MNSAKPIGDSVKEKFPHARSVSWLILVGIAFLGASGGAQLFINSHNWLMAFRAMVYLGFALIGVWALVCVVEGLSKLSSFFQSILSALLWIPRLIAFLYISLVKLLIKPVVIDIINNKQHVGKNFTLSKQFSDDHYWDQVLSFSQIKSIKFKVKPRNNTDYWRFGLKFSRDGVFPVQRHALSYPLFHLTKDLNENALRVTYYDENIKGTDEQIIKPYASEQIAILCDKKDEKLRIRVLNSSNNEVFSHKYDQGSHAYAQVLAWGDRHDFTLDVTYSRQ